MASTRQIEANRANAKMSTGPKSKDGKARSRMNSRKHGLTAKMLIIVDECADDFDELRTDLMEDFAPQSAMECELVERLAGIAWRLRRVPFFEAAILDARQAQLQHNARSQTGSFSRLQDLEVEEDVDAEEELTDDEWSIRVGDALIQDGIYGDGLGRLARHEATLMNGFTKTLQLLLLLQSNRSNTEGKALLSLSSAA